MMSLPKASIINIFKSLSVLFVCFMMVVFFRVVFVYEGPELKNKCKASKAAVNKKDIDTALDMPSEVKVEINMKEGKDVGDNQNIMQDNKREDKGMCLGNYAAYYLYAIILGAYINVKKLYKMGPI